MAIEIHLSWVKTLLSVFTWEISCTRNITSRSFRVLVYKCGEHHLAHRSLVRIRQITQLSAWDWGGQPCMAYSPHYHYWLPGCFLPSFHRYLLKACYDCVLFHLILVLVIPANVRSSGFSPLPPSLYSLGPLQLLCHFLPHLYII